MGSLCIFSPLGSGLWISWIVFLFLPVALSVLWSCSWLYDLIAKGEKGQNQFITSRDKLFSNAQGNIYLGI
jgi:hypothetical protein